MRLRWLTPLVLTGCALMPAQKATDKCVQALAVQGISVSDSAETIDLSTVLALLLASGQDISGTVVTCSGPFEDRTNLNLGAIVARKASIAISEATRLSKTIAKPQLPTHVRWQ